GCYLVQGDAMYACCVGTRFITEADAWLIAADSAVEFVEAYRRNGRSTEPVTSHRKCRRSPRVSVMLAALSAPAPSERELGICFDALTPREHDQVYRAVLAQSRSLRHRVSAAIAAAR